MLTLVYILETTKSDSETGSEEEEGYWNEIISRVEHVHARIGSTQHAQESSPSDEERELYHGLYPCFTPLATTKRIHLSPGVWKKVWDSKVKNPTRDWFSVTPEYGPTPYQIPSGADQQKELWDLIEKEKAGLISLFKTE